LSDDLADGGFAGSHEADERDILDVAGSAHPGEVTDLSGIRTKKTSRGAPLNCKIEWIYWLLLECA
jgi:hypothetical protein